MKNIRRLDISLTRRPASYRGPRSSEDWTDTFDELIRDLVELGSQWNTGIIKLFATLPDGEDDSTVDAFTNGIDGRTIYVDSSLTSSSIVTTYWHDIKERPKTLKEAFEDIYSYLSEQITNIQADLVSASGGLTTDQKSAIGANIFDASSSSSSSSLDGKSENNRLNIIQVAGDVYGTSYALDNDGMPNLTYSIQQMLGAVLDAHGGNWADDITLTHSGITVTQSSIDPSTVQDDNFVGIPGDTEDDLNQIRTQIKTYGGGASWQTVMPVLYGGGADSLRDLLNDTKGSTAKSATNPWGYQYDDIGGLITILDALKSFTGQDNYTDGSPDYPSTQYIANGDSLEDSIGVLDEVIDWAATPAMMRSGEHFRRLETALMSSGITVTHNRASWPQVEIIQISPDPLVSGLLPFIVKHNSLNEFELRLVDRNDFVTPSGIISSGIVLSCW